MLKRLGQYLKTRHCASVRDIAVALGSTPDAVRPMLRILIDKGRVTPVKQTLHCAENACCCCMFAELEMFAWVAPPDPAHCIAESIKAPRVSTPLPDSLSLTDQGCAADTGESLPQTPRA